MTSGAPPPAAPSLRGPPMNGKMKQDVHRSSARAADKFTSNGQQSINNNFGTTCDQTSLKLRIKVGSDNLSARKNAEIYSGLGLDVSPSSSFEASPVNSDDLCHVPNDVPCEESPTSILEVGKCFYVFIYLFYSSNDEIDFVGRSEYRVKHILVKTGMPFVIPIVMKWAGLG